MFLSNYLSFRYLTISPLSIAPLKGPRIITLCKGHPKAHFLKHDNILKDSVWLFESTRALFFLDTDHGGHEQWVGFFRFFLLLYLLSAVQGGNQRGRHVMGFLFNGHRIQTTIGLHSGWTWCPRKALQTCPSNWHQRRRWAPIVWLWQRARPLAPSVWKNMVGGRISRSKCWT